MNDTNKIINVIDTLRPFLISEGGNIEFIKEENDIVYIKMLGTCSSCEFVDYTITDVILNAIREEVPNIKQVININENAI